MSKATFLLLYLAALPLTYLLPYFGSNSMLAAAATGGASALGTVLHLACFGVMVLAAAMRSSSTDKSLLPMLPLAALAFDFVPGLSAIPFIPTIFHVMALVLGSGPDAVSQGSSVEDAFKLGDNEEPVWEARRSWAAWPMKMGLMAVAYFLIYRLAVHLNVPSALYQAILAAAISADVFELWKKHKYSAIGVTSQRVVSRVFKESFGAMNVSYRIVQLEMSSPLITSVKQGPLGKLFGYGTVVIRPAYMGQPGTEIRSAFITDPHGVERAVAEANRLAQERKARRNALLERLETSSLNEQDLPN